MSYAAPWSSGLSLSRAEASMRKLFVYTVFLVREWGGGGGGGGGGVFFFLGGGGGGGGGGEGLIQITEE